MEADTRLSEILALLRGAGDQPRAVVIADAVPSEHVAIPGAEVLDERALTRRLREGEAPTILVLERSPPALLRSLRDAPPELLVLTGDVDPEALASLARIPGLALLGPNATLRVGDGELLACATDREGLAELVDALSPEAIGVALSPTPSWLIEWLRDPEGELRAVGFVAAEALDVRWSAWVRERSIEDASRHILIPLGIEPPRVDAPRHPSLGRALAAHALERTTGPLFPSATVLAAVARGLHGVRRGYEPSAALLGRWNQARRALPLTGAAPGMDAPHPGLATDDPGAAFLAQRALLRQAQCLVLVRAGEFAGVAPGDDARIARSLEVLRGAGEILSEHESKVVLHGFGIEVTRQAVASSPSGAASFAETIGFPVVLKAVSPDLRRKREVGAVVLDLATAAAVRRAYASIISNVEEKAPTAHIDGVLVAEQIEEALEIHCGAIRLSTGEMALFGRATGLTTPQEQVLAASPLRDEDALLLANAILARVPVPALRRRSDPDVGVLAALFLRLDELIQGSEDRLLGVELNPIRLVGGDRGYVTLDARIVQRPHLEGL